MRNQKHFFVLILLFQALAIEIYAQHASQPIAGNLAPAAEVCGTAVLHDALLRTNPAFRQQIELNENLIQTAQKNKASSRTNQNTGQLLVIPLVVHIVHLGEAVGTGNNISDAQVQSAIVALNNIYRKKAGTYGAGAGVDMEIEFQLATRDPNCNPTSGIVRVNGSSVPNYATQGIKLQSVGAEDLAIKNLSRWPNTDYYNIWVVSEIDNGGGTAGYAYLPGAPANMDGTVLLNIAFGTLGTAANGMNRGLTLAHELGHAFNLYHTFEGDNGGSACPPVVNGCGSGQGDCVADTEPHKRSNVAYSWSCPAGAINSCTNAPIGNVYKNYMDYNSETCRTEFTQDQKDRVRAAISLFRPTLLNSQSLTSGNVNMPLAATCSPTGAVVNNGFGMGIYSVGIGNYTLRSDGTIGDNARLVDRSCHHQFGLEANAVCPITIITGTANNENVRVYLDYNNNGSFTDPGELIFNSSNVRTNHTGTFTPPATLTANSALRLRVISDFANNPITGPCYLPQFGQIEEYSVSFLSPLPVSLESFTARQATDQVLLQWQTAQEKNNQYFAIERSGNATHWQQIGKVNGAGISTSTQTYAFSDLQPITGKNYYRLKQVDFDGRSEFSQIRTVEFIATKSEFTIYPNPSHGLFTIKTENAGTIQLRIFDLNGRLLKEQNMAPQNPEISIQNYPAGFYFLEITAGQEISRVKLVKE